MWIQQPIDYNRHPLWGVSHWGQKRQQFYGYAVNRESALHVYSKRRIIAVTELKIVEWHDYKHLDWISPDTYRPDLKRREAYTAHSNSRGFIYQNKDKKNRLMRIDELYKFSDGTLNDVRNAFDDRLKGIRMQYLPTIIWRREDKDRAAEMIQAIEKLLKIRRIMRNTLTPDLLAGPTYELMRGSCSSLTELDYHLEEVYKATTDQLDWVNPEGQQYPHNLLQPLPLIPDNQGHRIVEWHDYKHLDWISVHRDDDHIYKLKEGDFKRLRLQDIEDMLLLLRRVEDLQLRVESYQKKLNLTKPDTYRTDLRRREAYTAYSNPRGFIYQNKDKKNRLMRIDELHKFSDGTLNDVRNALDDHLKGIRMQYLSSTIWRKGDKDRAAAMIQAIEKMLKTRRIMRSLEKFVGGRL
nr:hypothetical protein [Tanacetum cinerariifolium]